MDSHNSCDARAALQARETVRRFVNRGYQSSMESMLAVGGQPTEAQVRLAAEQIVAASVLDPAVRQALGGKKSLQGVVADLTQAFARIAQDGEAALLPPSEVSALEAISLLIDRPALLIIGGKFEPPTGAWSRLAANVQDLLPMFSSIGRLEVQHAYGGAIGTGFVVGENLIMTNRHVLDFLYTVNGDAGEFHSHISMKIDFKHEYGSSASSVFDITGIHHIFPEDSGVDLALLKVSGRGSASESLPKPLLLQSSLSAIKAGAAVCVVGYPQADADRNNEGEMDRIFERIYEVKRLAPGFVTSVNNNGSFTHDCSTLGGNSGSCVIDLETASVIGLHWGGDYLEPNHAVTLPLLAQSLNAVNFGDV